MPSVIDWFFEWLEYHQLLHPHRQWMRPEHQNALDFYQGWIEAFENLGATPELCRRASRKLQENAPKFLNDHLRDLRAAILDLRKPGNTSQVSLDGDQMPPGLVKASVESCDCPECAGTGWAKRRAYWPSLNWMPSVDLFCRCTAGRWRRNNDPDLVKGELRNYDDLQAHPELWNRELTCHLWSPRPTIADVEIAEVTEGLWHYLAPGDPLPRAEVDLAAIRVTRSARRPVTPPTSEPVPAF